jgi:hypothetical protein
MNSGPSPIGTLGFPGNSVATYRSCIDLFLSVYMV